MGITVKAAAKAMQVELVAQVKFDELTVDPERLKALASTLAEEAQSDEHARLMMREWARISQFVPTPADIVDMAGRVADPVAPSIPAGCAACGDRPWVVVERGEHSGVKRCTCARGQYFRARDAERKQATSSAPRSARGGMSKAKVSA